MKKLRQLLTGNDDVKVHDWNFISSLDLWNYAVLL